MKKITLILSMICLSIIMVIKVSAVSLDEIPAKVDNTIFYLNKNIILSTDLVIDENQSLVIDSGKRVTIKKGATIENHGTIYIADGSQLIVDDGSLVCEEDSFVLVNGKIKVNADGEIKVKNHSQLVFNSIGKFINDGDCLLYENGIIVYDPKEKDDLIDFSYSPLSAVIKMRSFDGTVLFCEQLSKDDLNEYIPSINSVCESDKQMPGGGFPYEIMIFYENGNLIKYVVYSDFFTIEGCNLYFSCDLNLYKMFS